MGSGKYAEVHLYIFSSRLYGNIKHNDQPHKKVLKLINTKMIETENYFTLYPEDLRYRAVWINEVPINGVVVGIYLSKGDLVGFVPDGERQVYQVSELSLVRVVSE